MSELVDYSNLHPETDITFFGDETLELLDQGYKIVTIRQASPKYQDIQHGTEVAAICPDHPDSEPGLNRAVPLVLIRNEQHPLSDVSDPILLLDGFPNADVALHDLQRYYPDLTEDSLVQAIATIPYSLWNTLTREQQDYLVSTELALTIRDPAFRHIFFPALMFWFEHYSDNAIDWLNWLIDMQIITEAEATDMLDFK